MTTKHSIERVYQRTRCNRKAAERVIEHAIERGKEISDFPEKEQRYLERKAAKNPGNECVYYNGTIFILTADRVCVPLLVLLGFF